MILVPPYHFLLISLHFVTTPAQYCDKPQGHPWNLSQEATFFNDDDDYDDDKSKGLSVALRLFKRYFVAV